jgi:hypothetical protein
MLAWYAIAVLGLSGQVRFFCQDETRLGLKTISGRQDHGQRHQAQRQSAVAVQGNLISTGLSNQALENTFSTSSLIQGGGGKRGGAGGWGGGRGGGWAGGVRPVVGGYGGGQ